MNEGGYLTIEEMISIPRLSEPAVSEDGSRVAWVRREPHWDGDEYRKHVCVYDSTAGITSVVAGGEVQSSAPGWSSRGDLAQLSRVGDDEDSVEQVFVVREGDRFQVTHIPTGVVAHRWAPDGRGLFYLAPDPDQDRALKRRRERYGDFEYLGCDGVWNRLFYLDVERGRSRSAAPADRPPDLREGEDDDPATPLTAGSRWHILDFDVTSDGGTVAFTAVPTPDFPGNADQAGLFLLDVPSGEITRLETEQVPQGYVRPLLSPDGTQLCYGVAVAEGKMFNTVTVEILELDSGERGRPLAHIDESIRPVCWTERGLVFTWQERTDWYVGMLRGDGEVIRLAADPGTVTMEASVSFDGQHLATITASSERPFEVFLDGAAVTDQYRHYRNRTVSQREVIRWKSHDGTQVEGILVTAPDLDRGVRHPLLVLVHGGPTWAAFAVPTHDLYYPYEEFVERGFIIVDVNYRGSSGYGDAFRKLNYRNLGLGDFDDVISGVDALVEGGLADPGRVGIMGWSQGGYISAMCCTYTDRFAAASVGAGISNWYTYYNNTDIPVFTRHYLGDTPWNDPEIYARTSPITYIHGARTPTLIQHGDRDARVPFANARELHRGLKDAGVDAVLVAFRGMGHGPNVPGMNRAIMKQNYAWFCHHLLGDTMDDLWLEVEDEGQGGS
ncbi:MAG: S9 family peptidase [Bacillota bacterium]